ncbi:response regulator [Stratiformator vulcanicus]|uniref:Response regulator PleD n=1 Tax=Stratiformator vulcanicus TaxID=2527980 RepID=A0A517R657_9PLAN|nr:response regulator [Stratiformator vulcanicus]QDT39313.1 Response regulator PleD [Stratiformator vulcanicus]
MPPKILIADDNQQNCELLEAYLADCDYEIVFAADGEQTLEVARQQRPDVILLDIMMPKLSGYEVCARLRAEEEIASIPILMITALDEPGDIDKAVEAGCDDFLTKPINSMELKICVESLLGIGGLEQECNRFLSYLDAVETASTAARA